MPEIELEGLHAGRPMTASSSGSLRAVAEESAEPAKSETTVARRAPGGSGSAAAGSSNAG